MNRVAHPPAGARIWWCRYRRFAAAERVLYSPTVSLITCRADPVTISRELGGAGDAAQSARRLRARERREVKSARRPRHVRMRSSSAGLPNASARLNPCSVSQARPKQQTSLVVYKHPIYACTTPALACSHKRAMAFHASSLDPIVEHLEISRPYPYSTKAKARTCTLRIQ